jgi:glycosyltransferase involved in cell wall biosynthesis
VKPVVSVVVPTRDRAGYLAVALDSLAAQELREPYEVVVVDDGSTDGTPGVVEHAAQRRDGPSGAPAAPVSSLRHERPRGLNAARNTGIRAARADLVAMVDDDVYAPPSWLRELVAGAGRHPGAEGFGGPIRARFEGRAPRGCGRESPPITALDLGPGDRDAELVWGANMAIRRAAFERVGPFDEGLPIGGDEEDWLRRLRSLGGRVVYLAEAGLDHRRAGDDARLRSLMQSAYYRGRNTRAYDARRGVAPSLMRELRALAGCGWHTLRRACPQGLVMGAHSAGRAREAVRRR